MNFIINYTNAFTQSAIDTIAMITGESLAVGESYVHHHTEIENAVAVYLNLIGQLQGYVLIRFSIENAKTMASTMMMGMPIETIDDMAVSALSELGNMIMGGASTNLAASNIITDISTPTLIQGTVQLKQSDLDPVSIPLFNDNLRIVLDVALKEQPTSVA